MVCVKRVTHACPSHVVGVIQCVVFTRVYASSCRDAAPLVTEVVLGGKARVTELGLPVEVLQPILGSRVCFSSSSSKLQAHKKFFGDTATQYRHSSGIK